MSRRRLAVALLAVPYACGIVLLLLWPQGEQVRRIQLDIYLYGLNHLGVPPSFDPDDYSAVANPRCTARPPRAAVGEARPDSSTPAAH